MASIKDYLKPGCDYKIIRRKTKEEQAVNPSIIRERLEPKLCDYSYFVTAGLRKIINRFINLAKRKKKPLHILDLGCGYKPFRTLFSKKDNYIGVDISENSYADVIADSQNLPFKDNLFDVIICSEIIEHCSNEYKLIKEIRRVSKNQTLVYISLPFIFPLHGVPEDFNRFTKYKLKALFQKDTILLLKESNNLFVSVFIYSSIILRILFGATKLLYPIYVLNNLLCLLAEKLSNLYRNKKGFIAEYWEYALKAFPMGYAMIVRIKK